MAANIGQGVDQGQSEYASDLSNIETQAARRGAPSQVSGSYFRARQRAAQGLLGRSAETRRKSVLTDAQLRRQDLYNRLSAESGALTGNAGTYNAVQPILGAQNAAGYEAVASLLSALASSGWGGGAAGGASGGGAAGAGAGAGATSGSSISRQGAYPVWA